MLSDIRHHPKELTLAAYAAGNLDEARSVVIATHVSMCSACRARLRDFEALGGACLDDIEPAEMSESALDSFWLRAGKQDGAAFGAPSKIAANDFELGGAHPLASYLKDGIDAIEWKPFVPGISQHVIPAEGYRPGVLRLLKIAPGMKISPHTHGDEELTLILRGSYVDEVGEFRPGDLADLDGGVTHAPLATGEAPCICLVAASAPLRFKTIIGRVAQPFFGM